MASAAMHMLAKQPLLRFGVGAGTAVVTERTLSAMAGTDQSMYTWIAGTTAGGAAWGFVGTELALGGIAGVMIGLSTQAAYFAITDAMKEK